VYIVDEVHMMSKQAFNAFLKTLEEPPPHVKFVFATTELEKVIETVRSRCQIVPLSLLGEDAIAARLEHIFRAENVAAGPGVAEELARLARGSMRDALSLSDQLLASSGDSVGIEDVRRLAGAGGPERVESVLDALERRDKTAVLEALEKSEGSEGVLVDALLEHLRGCLVALHCGERSQLFQAEASERERRAARATRIGGERLEQWLGELLVVRSRLAELPTHARVVLELALLDLCRVESQMPIAELVDRLTALEERLARGAAPLAARPLANAPSTPPSSAPRAALPPAAPAREPSARPPPPSAQSSAPGAANAALRASSATREIRPAPRTSSSSSSGAWSALVAELKSSDAALADALARCGKLADVGSSSARIELARLRDEDRAAIFTDAARQRCEAVIARLFGRSLRVIFEDASKRPPGEGDAFTRKVAELFQGRIEEH
jgi:DNA polymerase-3 subunit gamma/tau